MKLGILIAAALACVLIVVGGTRLSAQLAAPVLRSAEVSPLAAVAPLDAPMTFAYVGQLFNVYFDHDGLQVDGFKLLVDGAQIGNDLGVSANVKDRYFPPVSIGTAGPHQITVRAFNAMATADTAVTFQVNPVVTPVVPQNLRITLSLTVNAQGQIVLKALSGAVIK